MACDGANTRVSGLQRFAMEGLLRSLAVSPTRKKQGIGRGLFLRLEREALKSAVRRLVLLTETAESFFCHPGYRAPDQGQVSEGMKHSAPSFPYSVPPRPSAWPSRGRWHRY